jgi:hypothetical protein
MLMNDKHYIIIGLVVFFAALTFPFWYNLGSASSPPELVLTEKAKKAEICIEDADFMRREHMQILDDWRNKVVRDDLRIYTGKEGRTYTASLSNTCMDCHSNKADFCDKCHVYTAVDPHCWDCHTYPEVTK